MSDRRSRVLFVVEAVTLAHLARAYTLAMGLDRRRYEVALACAPGYDASFDFSAITKIGLESITSADFARALQRGAPVYRYATLEAYVRNDLAVIQGFDPDLVVGDFRLSLGVSARLAGRPYLNVTNAGWSPYARPRFVVPDIGLVGRRTWPIAQRVFDFLRPTIFRLHAAAIDRLRRVHGLSRSRYDLLSAYTDGDQTLYADVPELIPLADAPETHLFLGPIPWSPRLPAPEWAERVGRDGPLAYVALGSSGRHDRLPAIVDGLVQSGFAAVVASPAYRDEGRPNVHVAAMLDGDAWARRATVVVSNGGSPTCYQALRHGVPVLGVPSNLDQYLNMAAVDDFGAGLLVRSTEASAAAIGLTAGRLAADPRFVDRARSLARSIAAIDPHERFEHACQRALARDGGRGAIH